MKRWLWLFLLVSTAAVAQNVRIDGIAIGARGPVPFASVSVCTQPANTSATPCTPLANLCSSLTDSSCTSPNPLLADLLGNYHFYVPSGSIPVTIQIYGSNVATPYVLIDQGVVGGGGGGSVNCAAALNGSIAAFTSQTAVSCDPSMGTDFHGNGFAQSWKYLGPVNGFFGVIGGAPDPGTVPAYKLNTNEVRMLAPLTVPTPYYFRPPSTRCTTGQGWQMTGETTDANGDKVDTYGCATFASSGGVQAQVNGTNFANCAGGPPCSSPLINFIDAATTPAGLGLTWSNPSGGQVQPVLNDGNTKATNPSIPVATVNGTPASTDYKYAVAGCQTVDSSGNVSLSHCSQLSPVVDVTTGAATITSVNSITLANYADTLYGYRFYVVCRTSSSGSPATTGIIAKGVGKAFIDTGLAGDGSNCASLFATNTTVLSPLACMTSFSPGGNSMPGAPCGIDAPPLTVAVTSDEFTAQFGAPGDANDGYWTWLNQNSATATWTGGMLSLTAPSRSNTTNFNCLIHPVPGSTPFTYTSLVYNTFDGTTGSYYLMSGIMFYEQGTGKLTMLGLNNGGTNPYRFMVENGTITTESAPLIGQNNIWGNPSVIRIQDTGTNIVYSWSSDGISFQQIYTQAITVPFTTAPSHYGVCIWNRVGVSVADFDYIRRTQ